MPQSSHTPNRVTPGGVARAAFIALPVPILQAVIDRKISRDAGWLYACLLYHYDRKRGDGAVATTREALAGDMGVAKAANIDKYLRQLEMAGFVLIARQRVGRMKTKNMYTLLCLHDSSRSPNVGTSERPAETHETPAQRDVPTLGLRSPNIGTYVVPMLGPNPDVLYPEEKRSSGGTSYRERIAEVAETDDDEVDLIIEQIKNSAVGTIRNLGAYMSSVADDHIREHAVAVRAGSAERAEAARRAEQARQPRCGAHGINPWNACSCCWADVKAGSDPYAGRENLRPDGWREVYRPKRWGKRQPEPEPISQTAMPAQKPALRPIANGYADSSLTDTTNA